MGAGGSLPVGGSNEDFAFLSAFFAMKLVNRHEPDHNRAGLGVKHGTDILGRCTGWIAGYDRDLMWQRGTGKP
jgi:hypothetical protein